MKTTKWYFLLIVAVALLLGSGLTTTPRNQASASGLTKAAPPAVPAVCGQMNIVPSPNGGSTNTLRGVSALASNDVWAVGYTYTGGTYRALIEHWNGSAWVVVLSPNVGGLSDQLYGVSALASNDVWAVGNYYNNNGEQPLIEHWTGSAWAVVPTVNINPPST